MCSASEQEIKQIKILVNKKFRMKDLGTAKQYLGIEIKYYPTEKRLLLSQGKYIVSLSAEKYVIYSKNFTTTPMEINLKLEPPEEVEENLKYRNLIGALLYIANRTRPDIFFAVNYLSRYQNSYCKTEATN